MSTRTTSPQASGSDGRKARYIMIGGFLGAGKTTAIGLLARWLTEQGLRVGLITNDQGRHLVDTSLLRSQGFATEEIPGGCFCCRFNSLIEAARRLAETARPDIFLAEPVGSCTDLVATVTYPLRRLYGDNFSVAPVSVLMDPIRAARIFGLERGGSFSEKVRYIFQKQIEEADLVIISKCELLSQTQLDRLRQAVASRFPGKEILAVSARNGINLTDWFARLVSNEQSSRVAMEMDYQFYAEGESLLGWLNCCLQLTADPPFDAGYFLKELALDIQQRLRLCDAEVAHLKMTLSPDASLAGEIAAVNVVRNDSVPEVSFLLEDPVESGQLILNFRAEANPETLASIVRQALTAVARRFAGLRIVLEDQEYFRPGKPTPAHRIAHLSD